VPLDHVLPLAPFLSEGFAFFSIWLSSKSVLACVTYGRSTGAGFTRRGSRMWGGVGGRVTYARGGNQGWTLDGVFMIPHVWTLDGVFMIPHVYVFMSTARGGGAPLHHVLTILCRESAANSCCLVTNTISYGVFSADTQLGMFA